MLPSRTVLKTFKQLGHPDRQQVLQLLPDLAAPEQLAARLQWHPQQVQHHLQGLVQTGAVQQDSTGHFHLSPELELKLQHLQHPWLETGLDFFQLIDQCFADDGTLSSLPKSLPRRQRLLQKLALAFETGQTYTEKEVNQTLQHLTPDPMGWRRELIDHGCLQRTPSGSQYWREERTP